MKYIVFIALFGLFGIILSPIFIIKWSAAGFEKVFDGLEDICGIN